MRFNLVVNYLHDLNLPHNKECVNYIVSHWEYDHVEQLDNDYFEIDEEDVKLYWFSFVKNKMFGSN